MSYKDSEIRADYFDQIKNPKTLVHGKGLHVDDVKSVANDVTSKTEDEKY